MHPIGEAHGHAGQAGTTHRLKKPEIRRLISDAGWQPRQRDQYYNPIDPPRRRTPLPVTS